MTDQENIIKNLSQNWSMPSKNSSIIIIGAGGIVNDAHLPAYKKAGFEVKGIYDIDKKKAKSLAEKFDINKKYLVFSGIGNPESFKEILIKNKFNIIKEIIFPDHYNYNQNDIDKIKAQAKRLNATIVTTEKDYTKINSSNYDDIKFLQVDLKIKNEVELINYLKVNI